jgi:hypothetical protein
MRVSLAVRSCVQTQIRNKEASLSAFVSRSGGLRHAAVPDGEHTMLLLWCAPPADGVQILFPADGAPMFGVATSRHVDDLKLRRCHRTRGSGWWSPLSACGVAIGSVSQ